MKHLFFLALTLVYFDAKAQNFQEEMELISNSHNLIGTAVLVNCGDNLMGEYYGGVANIQTSQPVNQETLFRIASISKLVTGLGMMKILENTSTSLDSDISTALGYLVRNPDFPEIPITYRMLLSHTSSLQDGSGYSPFLSATYSSISPPNISEVLLPSGLFYSQNMWRTEAPGSYFAYSNLNYGLIGTLIEMLSGVRFDAFMRTEVLEPLGISGDYNVSSLSEIDNLSVLYRDNIAQWDNYQGVNPPPVVDENYIPGTNGALFAPQGGLRCAPHQLLHITSMLHNQGFYDGNQFLTAQSVGEMLLSQWAFSGSNGDNYFGLFNNWGLGIHRAGNTGFGDQVIADVLMMGHPGEAYGLISDLYFDPETGFSLVFMTNGYSQGGGYEFGTNTSFYAPEEETFTLIQNEFYGACQSLSSLPQQNPYTETCLKIATSNLGRIKLLHPEEVEFLAVYSSTGTLIGEYRSPNEEIFETYPAGIYLIRMKSSEGSCTQKISIAF